MITDAASADPSPQVAPEPPPAAPAGGSLVIDTDRTDRAPPSAPVEAASSPPAPPAPQAAAPVRPFVLRGVVFEGAGARERQLSPFVGRFVGRRMDQTGLNALTEALSRAYARTDVAVHSVQVPQQDFAGGIARIRVIEGYVESVDVRTTHGRRAPQVELYARRLLREHPLRKSSFDRQVALMHLLPGLTVDVKVLPGSRDGALRLVVRVSTQRLKAGVGVGDRGIHLLGRTQLEASASLHSIFRDGDRTSFTFITSVDGNRLRSYGLSHATPIGDSGLTVQGSLGYLTTRAKPSDQHGEAKLASLQATWPVILRNDRNLVFTAALDGLDASNALLGTTLTDERVRAVRGAAAYAQSFGAADSGNASALRVGGTLSQGLPGLGSRASSPGYSDTDFTKLSLQGVATHDYGRWQVRLHATAQLTDSRLPYFEQLPLGGEDYGRAFPAAIITGDEGAAGSVELAYRIAAGALPRRLQGSELYGFVDAGRVRIKSRPAMGLDGRTYDLASAGFGARVPVTDSLKLQLELSHQIDGHVPDAPADDWRVVVGARASY